MSEPTNPEVAVLNAALELPFGERAAYLDKACAGDAVLRHRVEELIQAHEQAVDFLEAPPAGLDFKRTVLVNVPLTEKTGDKIGRYKLLEQIGEGGCGVVYMADQEQPVRRRVALKVIKPGMDTRQVIARFEAERQALALMDHPNIAKVLDAGATETGRPYFVMELVRGIKITDYCDENNLPAEQRLDLFIKVAQAVQHAHQKGVIHRDLKPSNILVTINDGVPVPKVIDFGIAKATAGRLTDQTLFTAFEQFIGTPAYMSPEQAKMSGLDIDTRSDIYSLGVLLYELLTGRTPFDQNELLAAGLDEMRRTIREKEPLRPSTRLSTMLEGELTTTARNRHTDAPKLLHLLRGDLDWIVMKCLEKDRNRRYETASGLVADVRRHLNCEPVIACPPSRLYEFQKTVRRHKFGFAAAGAVIVALLAGLAVSTWLLAKEKAARTQAQAAEKSVRGEVEKNLFDLQLTGDMVSAMIHTSPSPEGRKELAGVIDRAVERLDATLKGKPDIEAHLRMICGLAYAEVGESEKAEAMLRRVVELGPKVSGEANLDVAASSDRLGMWHSDRGDFSGAEALFRNAAQMAKKISSGVNAQVMDSLNGLGLTLFRQNRFSAAAAAYREALTVRWKLPPNDPTVAAGVASGLYANLADAVRNLAGSLRAQGRQAEGEQALHEATEIILKTPDQDLAMLPPAVQELADALRSYGKSPEVEKLYERAINLAEQKLGETNHVLGDLLNPYAWSLATDPDPGNRDGSHAVLYAEKAVKATSRKNCEYLDTLAAAYAEAGQFTNALRAQEEAIALLGDGDRTEKEPFAARLRLYASATPYRDDGVLATRTRDLLATGKYAEAEPLARECLALREKQIPDDWRAFNARSMLGGALLGQKKYGEETEAMLLSGYAGMKQRADQIPVEGGPRLKETLQRLVELYTETNRPNQAAEWKRKLAEFDQAGVVGQSIPTRDPAAGTNLIDLSSFYNVRLTERWHGTGNSDLSALPRGIQTFAGVQFDVRGLIQLSASFHGVTKYPNEVRDIPVHGTCHRIHFLHAAIFGAGTPDGLRIGSYILHYASGTQSEFPIIIGQSLADWWDQPDDQGKTFTIAWVGQSTESRQLGRKVRLFKSTWENPAPNETVSSIDFIGYNKGAAPFLAAITAEP